MRLAIGASSILLMFSAALLAQMSPEEAQQKMQDRMAQEQAQAQQTAVAASEPSGLTNGEVAALRKQIAQQKDEITRLTDEVQELKAKLAMIVGTLPSAPAGTDAKAPSPVAGANASALITKYDRFRDLTTVETPILKVELTQPSLVTDMQITASASFSGKTVSGQTPELLLSVILLTGGILPNDGAKLIFLLDGVRADAISPAVDDGSGAVIYQIKPAELRAIAKSKKVEGQIGLTEFRLNPEQIAEIAGVYNTAAQGKR